MNKLLSGRRILVVEDEMMVLMLAQDMLEDLGCESVTAAATVEQAIGLIETQEYDAAMLDMNLNGNRSDTVADALAEHRIPFAFCTGYANLDMKEDYRNQPVLKKPFSLEDLKDALTRLLPKQDPHPDSARHAAGIGD